MVKNLRYVLMSMLVMLGMSAMAEDIIWQEDWTGCAANALPSEINPTYASEGTGTKIYDANLAGGTAPELLIAKNNGSFIVRIEFNGKHGDMVLSYMANYDRITVNVLQGAGVTLGEKTAVGNSYSIPMTVAEGSFDVTLQFQNTTSSNVRFDNAKLYQGTAKKPAGLSWGTASRTVTIGSDENLFPTLTNEQNLPVVFASDSTNVATIDQNGVITLVAAGSTNISASFAGNDEYEAQTVSYKLTVKAASGDDPTPTPTIDTITVAKAMEIGTALAGGKTTDVEYIVNGIVVEDPVWSPYKDKTTGEIKNYNVQLRMNDTMGVVENALLVYNPYNLENTYFPTIDESLAVGTEVSLQGKIQNYVKNEVSTIEFVKAHFLKIGLQTAVNAVKADSRLQGTIYNLKGQRVKVAGKGLYIVNGKKVFMK